MTSRRPGRRCVFIFAAAPLLLCTLLERPGRGQSLAETQNRVGALERQAATLTIRQGRQAATREQLAEHRLVDGEVLYTLKDYTRAAIVLLDYVSKYKGTRGYPEAVFYLAESFYLRRDYQSARRYFRVIAKEIQGKYYQEALQRLLELSLRTGDYSDVEEYLSALSNIPPSMLKSSVPYVLGKYYFFRKDLDKAQASFRSIPQGNLYFLHAQYFLGTLQVQRGDFAGATQYFKVILKASPTTKGQEHVRDLAYLAIGRLLYEQGKINEAIDMYQKVSRRSPDFDTSLYEIAWAYIKAKKHRQALQALELLALAQPKSTFLPQVQVLQGNLMIRLKEWSNATKLFTTAREKFVPIHNRMKQIMREHSDPNVFFDILLAKNVGNFATTIQIPELVLQWVKQDANVKRALELVEDVREIQASLDESRKLMRRLEGAINSPAKIKIFPELELSKAEALVVENQLARLRKQIVDAEVELVMSVADGPKRQELEQLARQRRGWDGHIRELPVNITDYDKRKQDKLQQIMALEKNLQQLATLVDSLSAQLVAAEKFFVDTSKIQRGEKKEAVRRSFRKEADTIKVMVIGLQSEVDEIQAALEDAKNAVGVGGAEEVAERKIKVQYRDSLARTHEVVVALRDKLSGGQASELDGWIRLFGRCKNIDAVLDNFDQQLERTVDGQLKEIRTALVEEQKQLGEFESEITDCRIQTDKVAGGITYDGFKDVAKRFYEVVVRSDVGIIDVAWALKDAKSNEVSQVVRQQKMDLKLLDTEFKEVLTED